MSSRRPAPARLGGPLGLSAFVHVGALAAVAVFARPEPAPVLPPVYRVQLFAAPPGPRQIGVVQPPAARAPEPVPAAAPEPATPPPAPEMKAREMPSPTKPADPPKRPQQVATPNTATTRTPPKAATTKAAEPTKGETKAETPTKAPPVKAPVAGGGPEGGRGADVANVNTPGVDFPFPSYLQNIVRQITVRFAPPPNSALSAQVRFTIRRDGSVPRASIIVTKGSGSYEFDAEASAAVEAAGRSGDFGPLPTGFRDDALTVYFAFDPRVIR